MTGEPTSRASSTLIVLPGRPGRAAVVDARAIAAAGLARGLRRTTGGGQIVDANGMHDPDVPSADPVREAPRGSAMRPLVRRMPAWLRPALGDLAAIRADGVMRRNLRRLDAGPPERIVQFHHRFQRATLGFARRHGVPLAIRVEALEVREEAGWGVRRPGYADLVERRGELAILRHADLVVPVSDELDRTLDGIGIPAERRVVVPNGVDLDAFRPGPPDPDLRNTPGLRGRFVVGWIGGFRPFHGLGMVARAVARIRSIREDAVLCLVGSGPLREELGRLAATSGGALVVAGPADHHEVPRWIRTFDVCVLFGEPGAFHYSPLKLLEYQACGRATVVPALGDLSAQVRDGHDALVVPPGDPVALADAVLRLAADPELRGRLGANARRSVEATGSWDARARAIVDGLAERAGSSRAGVAARG